MLLGAWAAVGGGVWIGGAARAGALPLGSAALSLPPYVCAVTWWQRQALIWLAPAFWDGFGTAQAARLEERSGMDGAGRVRLFFPQHFWSVIN